MVRYYKKQNEEKKVAAIKEKAASEVDKIKLVCKEINEHIEQYYRLCKLIYGNRMTYKCPTFITQLQVLKILFALTILFGVLKIVLVN